MKKAHYIFALIATLIFMLILFLISGCVSPRAKDSAQATQGIGFQSASGNRGEIGDIGDRAGRDIEKTDLTSKPLVVRPQAKQGSGIQYGKTVVTDVWAIVLFFLGFVLLREGFSYLRMRLKQTM